MNSKREWDCTTFESDVAFAKLLDAPMNATNTQ